MLDFYYVATPQGQQLLMFLEETGLPFRRIPKAKSLAMVDHWPMDAGEPLPLQESGAMLLYLAEKAGFGLPAGMRARAAARQWLFWQKSFECQGNRTAELFSTLDKQLAEQAYLCGEQYSVADIACFPLVSARGARLAAYPSLARWFHAVSQRPATQRAYGREMSTSVPDPEVDTEAGISALAGVLP
ncbi:GST-like protein [Duganella sp. CF458]|uniref:glutathione binding-like protein n=1 Tax=Duganella sp. CF458 TaxID=1884368 RepID=UPI0008E0F57F|nr:glutathione binding-like protein [Duganella sp. CF458]SFF91180.1 GST-like protein [Duganella sp. CF458]